MSVEYAHHGRCPGCASNPRSQLPSPMHEPLGRLHVRFEYKYFVIGFPSGCVYYEGPHPLECMDSVWQMVGCIDVGSKRPQDLPSFEFLALSRMTLK